MCHIFFIFYRVYSTGLPAVLNEIMKVKALLAEVTFCWDILSHEKNPDPGNKDLALAIFSGFSDSDPDP